MSTEQYEPGEAGNLPHDGQNGQNGQEEASRTIDSPSLQQSEDMSISRQERALRYLERKRIRQERTSQQVISLPEDDEDTDPALPVVGTYSELQKSGRPVLELKQSLTVETVQSRHRRWHRKILLRHMSRKHIRHVRQEKQNATKKLWITISSVFFASLALLLSLSGVGAFAAYRFYNSTQAKYMGQILTLHDLMPQDNLKMYDSKNVLIAQLTNEGLHTSVPYQSVARDLVNATVATEDKNFWNNPGIDLTRIIQAAIDNMRIGHVVAGGSTITQQLIKNLVVGNESSVTRKLEEIVLVPQLNSLYSKTDIIGMYLNTIYYGEQAYGIDAAANIYFGLKDLPDKPAAAQLDLAQAAMLAGIPALPDQYDPLRYPTTAYNRFTQVLSFMFRDGYISRLEELNALTEAQQPGFFKRPATLVNRAPHFAEFVYAQLEQTFHMTRQQLARSDMSVYTTLDLGLQDKIQKIAQNHIAELRDAHHLTNAAEVLIDYHTGAILSLLGSIDYNNKSINGQYDVATQGYRQPGSSFKPFVYVTAFSQGASPAQAISDEPTTIDLPLGSDPSTFTPLNYDRGYHGHMTLRCALQNSLNIPAVRTLAHVGISQAVTTAQNMGIASYNGTPGYSLVLGGLGVHLLDETSAYGTFANGGMHMPYYAVDKVVMSNSHQAYGHAKNTGKQAISKQLAYMMTSVLSDNTSRLPEFFDCNVLQLYANSQSDCWYGNRGAVRPAAAKTGTTNDFRDNWTVGYTTDYVMGVWAGNNDNTPMNNVTGVQGAAPIWHDSMLAAEQGHPIRDFSNPGGLTQASVTYADGVRATDWFLPGTIPQSAPLPKGGTVVPQPPTQNGYASMFAVKPPAHTPPPVVAAPYCSNDFTFAFSPPKSGTFSPLDGWW